MLHKILFIAGKTENKNATAEHRQLTERIKAATQRDNLAMREVFDATIEDILQAEAQFLPTIFHFIGDGTAQGLSIFNNNTALKSFFTQRKERIEIAFFNADHSATQARMVSELGSYAIGMNGRISKRAAIRFSTGFYLGLGEGKSVENAFEDGMIIIEAEFPKEKHIPMLWKAGERISEIQIVEHIPPKEPLKDQFWSQLIEWIKQQKSIETPHSSATKTMVLVTLTIYIIAFFYHLFERDIQRLMENTLSKQEEISTPPEYNAKGDEFYLRKYYKEALNWYRKSAEQGNSAAQHNLGIMYRNGEGVKQDYIEALKWYRLSAEQENSGAQFGLGNMYRDGEGVKQDYIEAVKWYRSSAEQGNSYGQNNLGFMYQNGYGVEKDSIEAVKWYRLSAEQGNSYGQCSLGYMYQKGYGVEKDYIEAVKWYRKSAEQGNSLGQCNLGWMCRNGYGVEKDYIEAVKWFRLSAEQGDSSGQCNLGWMYQYGYGVEKKSISRY